MKLRMARMGKVAMTAVALAMMTALGAGCAIHSQSPIKEIAYDFSDADFYDRAYAPSPQYAEGYVEYVEDQAPLRSSAVTTLSAPGAMGVVLTAPPGPPPLVGLDESGSADGSLDSATLETVGKARHVSGEALRLRAAAALSGLR